MNAYTLHVGAFQGPLEKLLELIEEKKLDITNINLAKVTNDFIAYVGYIEKTETRTLADFVSVAAKLLLIKSKILLPTLELTESDEIDIRDLQTKLAQYQRVRECARAIQSRWAKNTICYSRALFKGMDGEIHPETKISIASVVSAIRKILNAKSETIYEQRHVQNKKTLEQTIQRIVTAIRTGYGKSFHTFKNGKNREEIIMIFLALLHLAKLGDIHIDQKNAFDDILITE